MTWLDARIARLRPYRVVAPGDLRWLAWLSCARDLRDRASRRHRARRRVGRRRRARGGGCARCNSCSAESSGCITVELASGRLDELAMLGAVTAIVGAVLSVVNVAALELARAALGPARRDVHGACGRCLVPGCAPAAPWTRAAASFRRRQPTRAHPRRGGRRSRAGPVDAPRPEPGVATGRAARRRRPAAPPPVPRRSGAWARLPTSGAVAKQTGCRNVIIAIPSASRAT